MKHTKCKTEMIDRTYEYKKGHVKITPYCPKCKVFPEYEERGNASK